MTDIQKGKQYTFKAKFSKNGAPATFIQPPKWTLYNSNDDEIISGAAVRSGNIWEATFTVSNNYVVDGGKEELLLQFDGKDNKNASFTKDIDLTLIDSSDAYKPDGLIYNLLSPNLIKDTILLPYEVSEFEVKILSPIGVQVGEALTITPGAPNKSSNGWTYTFNVPLLSITANPYLDPYQLLIEYEGPDGTEQEMHPIYLLNMKVINIVTALRQYLDKAKLVEIDPSLQWSATEYVQAVYEGIKYINGFQPEGTFWSTEVFPSTLDQFLMLASAFYALNARFLAEGLQAFEFSGLNSQLTFNRTDALQAKMGEIQGILDSQLPLAKKSAINIIGKGTAPDGGIDRRIRNLGTNGFTINLMNNRRNYTRMRRLF